MANPLRRMVSSGQVSGWYGQPQLTVPARPPSFSAALWTPAQITTALWLDFADSSTLTIVNNRVSQITDKSGNGRTASNSTASQRPVYCAVAQNGLPSAYFARNGHLAITWTITGTGWHAFALASLDSLGGNFPRLLSARATGQSVDWNNTTSWAIMTRNATTSQIRTEHNSAGSGNATVTIDEMNVLNASLLSGSTEFRVNGGTALTGASGNSLNTTDGVRLGSSWSDPERWAGLCGEVIFVSSISTANRENIEGYLAHKWGIASKLPVGHPYASAPPTV